MACLAHLPGNTAACASCGLPITGGIEKDLLCGHCSQNKASYDVIRAPFLYAEPLDKLITDLKFNQQFPKGRLLGYLMSQHLRNLDKAPEILLPAPLHPSRLKERGFNQATELTRWISKETGIPWSAALLSRRKATRPQSGLKMKERHGNMKNAFVFKAEMKYQHIAIIDDVVTTGATANAMAEAVKSGGVEKVEVWSVARTPEPGS